MNLSKEHNELSPIVNSINELKKCQSEIDGVDEILNNNNTDSLLKEEALKELSKLKKLLIELRDVVRNEIGAIATPQQFYFVTKLPKTRSGKIMRRLLKSIVCGEKIGDTSTLEDKTSVNEVQSAFNDQTL